VLVVGEVRHWLDTTAPRGTLGGPGVVDEGSPVAPLVTALSEGVPEGTALVMGAWCGRQPKGALVDAVAAAATTVGAAAERPKPGGRSAVAGPVAVRSGAAAREAREVRFERGAERLLLERLGFEPRRLVQEIRKLASAAGTDGVVDEGLVRRLVLPKERSLEVVRDGVFGRDPRPLLELIAAAAEGVSVNDWYGQPMAPKWFAGALYGQVANLLGQMLYLRRVADAAGLAASCLPSATAARLVPAGVPRLAPVLAERLEADKPHPLLHRKGKAPSRWNLGELFRGAARFSDDELVAALAAGGEVELALRGDLGLEALTAWIARSLSPRPSTDRDA
jgi:hypothetical protein